MLAELAVQVGPSRGLTIEVFGEDELREMGCGGILGVNAGSVEPPRMIKMTYRPDGRAERPAGDCRQDADVRLGRSQLEPLLTKCTLR